MKISDIKRNPENPRIIKDDKFKKLVNSIKEFPKMMELRPIVIDSDNVVLGGNMRLKALQHLGYKEVPDGWVKQADELTDDEKKRFIISDNSSFGEWDWDTLANEWESDELSEWGVDMANWDDDFQTIENDELGLSQNKNDVYGGNSIPVRIGNFLGYIQDEDLANFIDRFNQNFEENDEKKAQQARNEASLRILSLIKSNENIILVK